MEDSPDRELIRRALRGEVEAYGELVTRSQAAVYNVCYRLTGERFEAEDMTQETFLRAHERLSTFDLDRPFLPWIQRVAANLCLNHLAVHRRDAFQLDEERDPADAAEQPAVAAEQREQSQRVQEALSELPPRFRVIIELRHFQDLSYDQIAQTLKVPLSDVKSDLFRARKLLAGKLKDAPSL